MKFCVKSLSTINQIVTILIRQFHGIFHPCALRTASHSLSAPFDVCWKGLLRSFIAVVNCTILWRFHSNWRFYGVIWCRHCSLIVEIDARRANARWFRCKAFTFLSAHRHVRFSLISFYNITVQMPNAIRRWFMLLRLTFAERIFFFYFFSFIIDQMFLWCRKYFSNWK